MYSKTQVESLDIFDEYVTVGSSTYSWEKIGDTRMDLSNVVTNVTLSKSTTTVVTGYSSVATSNVIGANATFSFTQPTISVTPSTTYLGATATGAAVGADGTANAITGFGNHTTDTFVKSVSAETGKNLVTTTVPNVTNVGSAASWTFTMGSGAASETLIIGGGNGTAPTLGTAITVATGATSTTGSGAAVVTGVTIGASASAITALGTPTTASCLTGVKVTTQPTISLAANGATATGRVQLVTGISSATATNGAVAFNSKDQVAAMTGLGSAATATVLNNSTDVVVSKGNS